MFGGGGNDVLGDSLRTHNSFYFCGDGHFVSGNRNHFVACSRFSARPRMEASVIMIELRYDENTRTFKLLNPEAAEMFDDGQMYVVVVSESGFEAFAEPIDLRIANIAHA